MSRVKRKKTFVDRKVQGALVRRVLLHWAAFVFTITLSVALLQFLLSDARMTIGEHFREAWSQFALFYVILIALLPAFLLDTVKVSNRFVGPVMRLRRALRQLNEGGKVEKLKFRENDFWKEIAEDFNGAVARINGDPAETVESPKTRQKAS